MVDLAIRVCAIEIDNRRIAIGNRTAFDRLLLGAAFAQPLERLLDAVFGDDGRMLTQRDR